MQWTVNNYSQKIQKRNIKCILEQNATLNNLVRYNEDQNLRINSIKILGAKWAVLQSSMQTMTFIYYTIDNFSVQGYTENV